MIFLLTFVSRAEQLPRQLTMKKVVTIFNEKGGVGKTTLSVLLADFLAYYENPSIGKKKENVTVYDFDYPSYHLSAMRLEDEKTLQSGNPEFVKAVGSAVPYPIARVKGGGLNDKSVTAYIKKQRETGDGYIIMDFPGRFNPSDPVFTLTFAGLIDLFVIIIDSDRQSQESALKIAGFFSDERIAAQCGKPGGQEFMFVWNRETSSERTGKRDWYSIKEEYFRNMGIPVAKTRIRDILTLRRDSGIYGFVRNTMCWPEKNIEMRCPYMTTLFMEIKDALDNGLKKQ